MFLYKEKRYEGIDYRVQPVGQYGWSSGEPERSPEGGGADARIVDVTGSPEILVRKDHASLNDSLGEYDVLCVGGPVYAHHLQYHASDLIGALPLPADGRLAFTSVTYGGVVLDDASACLHCFSCVPACPRGAIAPRGDMEAARGFIENMLKNGNEAPLSAVYR